MWSSSPLPSHYNMLADPYPFENVVPGFAGVVPYQMIPFNYCLLVNSLDSPYSNQSPEDARKLLLNRSIFDLVNSYKFLQLTDQHLLGWYLSLNVGDRRIIQAEGGFRLFLQRHPALGLTHHHVYVKYSRGHTTFSRATMSSNLNKPSEPVFTKAALEENHGASGCPSGAARCSDLGVDRRELECLPNTVRESLNLLDHHQDFQDQSLRAGSNNPALFEDSPGQASASLDAELEHQMSSWTPLPALQSLPGCAETDPSLPSPSAGEQGDPSEFHSFDRSQPFSPGLDRSGASYPMKPEWDSSTGRSGGKACPDGTSPPGAGGPEEEGEDGSVFHSVLEERESVPAAEPSGRPGAPAARDRSGGAGGEGQRNPSAPGNAGVDEKAASPPPLVVTCSVAVGTGPRAASADAQTEAVPTAEKGVSTTVHMADLDYLAMEFVKLKSAKKELQELKQQLKSSQETGGRAPCEGCGGRAQRAELRLLALHYVMCQQHAWGDGNTSSTSSATTHAELRPQGPPAELVAVCRKLQGDYREMRGKILAGASLEDLRPLSVASATPASGPYSPPEMLDDALQDAAASAGPPESWNMETLGGRESAPPPKGQDPEKAEGHGAPVSQSKVNGSHGAASLTPERGGTTSVRAADPTPAGAAVNEEGAGARQAEVSPSEVWYDAEDEPPPRAEDVPSGADDGAKEGRPEEEQEQESSWLCVSGLPEDVTKTEVMQWFEKDHVSEVRICTFRNNLKVALVMLNGPPSTELALGQMKVRGSTVHVEHIRPGAQGLDPPPPRPAASSEAPEQAGAAPTPEATKTEHLDAAVKYHATMGSFDRLMEQLAERHPEAGRRAIVEALLEVKAEHGGVLSGLPLSGIADMTSRQLLLAAASSEAAGALRRE